MPNILGELPPYVAKAVDTIAAELVDLYSQGPKEEQLKYSFLFLSCIAIPLSVGFRDRSMVAGLEGKSSDGTELFSKLTSPGTLDHYPGTNFLSRESLCSG